MGIRDSKLSLLPYDDAVKQVKKDDLQRLKDVFKRYGPNGTISEQVFTGEVLTDGVPRKLSERIFAACGGTSKGLHFKELLCFLVVFTSGSRELRMKLLYAIFSLDGSSINRRDVEAVILMCDPQVPSCVAELFENTDLVDFDEFSKWATMHMNKMSLTKWFLGEKEGTRPHLSDEHDPPTFYQMLARITKLKEEEIMAMEKCYNHIKMNCKSGKFDVDAFVTLTSPPLPERLSRVLFQVMDTNPDNHLDMKEVARAVSLLCRGSPTEQQRFVFKIFDQDQDGLLKTTELESMIKTLADVQIICQAEVLPQNLSSGSEEEAIGSVKNAIRKHLYSSINDGVSEVVLTADDYVTWSEDAIWPKQLGDLLYEVCHVLLGLQPATPADEGRVVRGWIARNNKAGRPEGSSWYLLSTTWWKSWCDYVKGNSSSENGSSGSPLERHQLASPSTSGRSSAASAHEDMSPRSSSRQRGSNPSPVPGSQGLGAVDNSVLCAPEPRRNMVVLTNEGGTLRRGLMTEGKDFQLLSEPVWRVLIAWHGGGPALPRTMVSDGHGGVDIDLHLITIRLYRHTTSASRNATAGPLAQFAFANVWSWLSGAVRSSASASGSSAAGACGQPPLPRRYLAYYGAYSRHKTIGELQESLSARLFLKAEEFRLWELKADGSTVLLEDEKVKLNSFNFETSSVIIDVRNKDLTWPEEMCSIAAAAKSKEKEKKKSVGPIQKGTTGLSNLGNSCFMNSAVQCISNTQPLTLYFNSSFHLDELNRTNPLGMKGNLAKRYGDLVVDLWSGTSKSIAPLRLRVTIAKYMPRFSGFQQQDSQELLAFLLDGLHEDLNRITVKPYVELRDSDGRPDAEVAQEAWDNHLKRNQSVVVELFHGQLKSHVRCLECGHSNVRFDPFTFLSLPLPMVNTIYLEVIVVRLDGSVPVKYALRLERETRYSKLKVEIGKLCGIPSSRLIIVELSNCRVHNAMMDSQKIYTVLDGRLYAYEIPALPIEPTERSESVENIAQKERLTAVQVDTSATPAASAERLEEAELVNTMQQAPSNERQTYGETTAAELMTNDEKVEHAERQPQATAKVASASSASSKSIFSSCFTSPLPSSVFEGFVFALHRKTYMTDQYFITASKARPVIFGIPIVVPCLHTTPHCQLYRSIMSQLESFVSAPDPELSTDNEGEFPFVLKAVEKGGLRCGVCPWWKLCSGCTIACDDEPFNDLTAYVAIDWDATALHLRYQPGRERLVHDDESVEKCNDSKMDPIDLIECLKAFTKEEELDEDALWYCGKCKKHQLAAKKLDIWSLPPILIIHLKRFQFVNGQWVKSLKKVKFPMTDLNLHDMVVQCSPERRVEELSESAGKRHEQAANGITDATEGKVVALCCAEQEDVQVKEMTDCSSTDQLSNGDVLIGESVSLDDHETRNSTGGQVDSMENGVEEVREGMPTSAQGSSPTKPSRHQSVREPADIDPLTSAMVMEAVRQADIQNGLLPGGQEEEEKDEQALKKSSDQPSLNSGVSLKTRVACTMAERLGTVGQTDGEFTYNLYAMTIHTGMMSGGHYVTFACNPDGNWYLFNDSTCKKIEGETLTEESPYLLFYERSDIDYRSFLPEKRAGHCADDGDDEDIENALKRCSIM